MRMFEDGDQIAVVLDNFINLQESPAVFVPKDSRLGRHLLEHPTMLPIEDSIRLRDELRSQRMSKRQQYWKQRVEQVGNA